MMLAAWVNIFKCYESWAGRPPFLFLFLSLPCAYRVTLPPSDLASLPDCCGLSPSSELLEDVEDELTQVFVDVPPAGVETLGDVFKRLEEAVEVHLGVFAAPHYVLVNYVVVGLADMRVSHIFKFGQSLELVARDEVVILLACQDFKDGLSLRVQVQLVVVAFWVRKNQFQKTLLGRPSVHGRFLLGLTSFPLFPLSVSPCLLVEHAGS